MNTVVYLILSTLFSIVITLPITNKSLDDCTCRDWYGRCKTVGDQWIDDDIWAYRCDQTNTTFIGCISNSNHTMIATHTNITIDNFWFSCESDDQKIKYEQEPYCTVNDTDYHVGDEFRNGVFQWVCLDSGRWIIGCFYKDEVDNEILLKIGETAVVGLIRHYCERYVDYPGRVQYYAQVRPDAQFKSPKNKGTNKNLPPNINNTLTIQPLRWLHENAAAFIENENRFDVKIRYVRPNGFG